MFPSDFEYAAPATVDEAIALLQTNEDAKILAGGHSLLPLMKTRLSSPALLVDIGRIPELRRISVNGTATIGATATYRDIAASEELARAYPILRDAIHKVGDVQVRNRGTLGGALAHADPAADMTAVVLALGASLTVRGPQGERTIPADDFFVDLLQTQLEPDELLTEISLPLPAGRTGMAYEKFKHPASGYAIVGVAAVIVLNQAGTVDACRVAVTGAGPKPQRATSVEAQLVGNQADDAAIAAAAALAAEGIELLSDLAASEEFRAHLVRVHTRRALQRAVAAAR
jgi:carbon-monoxide dehydrogenase medium subunit